MEKERRTRFFNPNKARLVYLGPKMTAILDNTYPRFQKKVRRKFGRKIDFTDFTDLLADGLLAQSETLMHAKLKPVPKPHSKGQKIRLEYC